MTKEKCRILFVCYADSPHSQAWINAVTSVGFDARVFAVEMPAGYPPLEWHVRTYTFFPPGTEQQRTQAISLVPRLPAFNSLVRRVCDRFAARRRWLKRIVRLWRPHFVHSLSL